MSKSTWIVAVMAALTLGIAAAPALAVNFVTFDRRENLNLLNSPDVTITALYPTSNNSNGSELRGYAGETSTSGVGWFSAFSTSQNEVFTIDLGATRNIETIRATANAAGDLRRINTATIETSSNGVTWSGPLAHSVNYFAHGVPGQESRFVLNSPANARWLRVTTTDYTYKEPTFASRQVALQQLAVYGSAGTVTADKGLDIISRDGWTAGAGGGVTITTNGNTQADWLRGIAEDNEADSDNRQLIYEMTVGKIATATFASTVDSIGRVGIGHHGASAKNMSYNFYGSTDNFATNSTLLYSHNGVANPATWFGPRFFDLATPFTGNAIRVEITSTGSGSFAYLSDMFAFQVPEPGSLALIGVAALGLIARRHRRAAM